MERFPRKYLTAKIKMMNNVYSELFFPCIKKGENKNLYLLVYSKSL